MKTCSVCQKDRPLSDFDSEDSPCRACKKQSPPSAISELLIDSDPRSIQAMSTDELRAELARGLALVAENLFRCGLIWVELEKRGEDLAPLRRGIAVYLPLIGAGRVDARAVVRFAGTPALLRAVTLLPIEEQVRLGMGNTVPLVLEDGAVQATDPLRLTAPQINQVFAAGLIRSTAEQKEILSRRLNRAVKKTAVRYDRAKGGRFLINRQVVPMSQIIAAMAASEPAAKRKEKMVKVEATLPESFLASLKLGAAEGGRDFGAALLHAVRLAGMAD